MDQIAYFLDSATKNRRWEMIETANINRLALNSPGKTWKDFSSGYLSSMNRTKQDKQGIVLSDKKLWFLNSMLKG